MRVALVLVFSLGFHQDIPEFTCTSGLGGLFPVAAVFADVPDREDAFGVADADLDVRASLIQLPLQTLLSGEVGTYTALAVSSGFLACSHSLYI